MVEGYGRKDSSRRGQKEGGRDRNRTVQCRNPLVRKRRNVNRQRVNKKCEHQHIIFIVKKLENILENVQSTQHIG